MQQGKPFHELTLEVHTTVLSHVRQLNVACRTFATDMCRSLYSSVSSSRQHMWPQSIQGCDMCYLPILLAAFCSQVLLAAGLTTSSANSVNFRPGCFQSSHNCDYGLSHRMHHRSTQKQRVSTCRVTHVQEVCISCNSSSVSP